MLLNHLLRYKLESTLKRLPLDLCLKQFSCTRNLPVHFKISIFFQSWIQDKKSISIASKYICVSMVLSWHQTNSIVVLNNISLDISINLVSFGVNRARWRGCVKINRKEGKRSVINVYLTLIFLHVVMKAEKGSYLGGERKALCQV